DKSDLREGSISSRCRGGGSRTSLGYHGPVRKSFPMESPKSRSNGRNNGHSRLIGWRAAKLEKQQIPMREVREMSSREPCSVPKMCQTCEWATKSVPFGALTPNTVAQTAALLLEEAGKRT